MKKLLTIFAALVLLFGFTAGAQAAMQTVNFDDLTAGELWFDQYEAQGGINMVHPLGFGFDGYVITDASIATTDPNYIYCYGDPGAGQSGGVALYFSTPVDFVSFDWGMATGMYGVWYGDYTPGMDPGDIVLNAVAGPIGGMFFPSGALTNQVVDPGVVFNMLLIGPPMGGQIAFDTFSYNQVDTVVPTPPIVPNILLPLLLSD